MLITGDATEIYIDFTNGTKLELGPASEVLLDQSVYRLQAFGDADVIADVVALQQSILDGVTDLADLESTEAGVGQLGSAASLESIPLYAREGPGCIRATARSAHTQRAPPWRCVTNFD